MDIDDARLPIKARDYINSQQPDCILTTTEWVQLIDDQHLWGKNVMIVSFGDGFVQTMLTLPYVHNDTTTAEFSRFRTSMNQE